MQSNHRRLLLKFLAACAVTPALPARALGNRPLNPTIYRLQGQAKVNGNAVDEGTTITPGDRIETGEGSELIFVVGKDAFLARSNTVVELQGGNGVVNLLRIISGAVLSVYGPGRERQIETPVATLGIRGTGVYAEATPKETYFCTCYGEAVMSANADPRVTRRVKTSHHEAPVRFLLREGGVELEGADMRNHSDAELTLLESTVGRRPPFAQQGYNEYRY